MKTVLKNFRLVDENTDRPGTVIIENGTINDVIYRKEGTETAETSFYRATPEIIVDGKDRLVLMPAFVDLHAHFRDSLIYDQSFPSETQFPSETVESASMSAAAGGYGTVVCMANTKPVTDSVVMAKSIKDRSDKLGLVDLYPVLSLTKNMDGRELSEITLLNKSEQLQSNSAEKTYMPLMLSEDGKDPADDDLFLSAMKEAKRLGLPVSCHCDLGDYRGDEAEAVRRVIELGKKAGCHIHIAHISTRETAEVIRAEKARAQNGGTGNGFKLSCEVMPHNLCLTEADAEKLGRESWGRVNPPLRKDHDREALAFALQDGTIDAIATDHAPHTDKDKDNGVPGFTAFETAFASVYTDLIFQKNKNAKLNLSALSFLMSAKPARLIGKENDRGLLKAGYRADLVIIDIDKSWEVNKAAFLSRGKNTPFRDKVLYGKILMTLHSGRVVFNSL